MKNQFSLFDLLILIGIIQGIITSILLFRTRKNSKSNSFLALAILSFCLLNTKPLLNTLHLWDTAFFRFFPNSLELAIAPLIYFYIVSIVNPSFSFKTKYWLHFVPFLLSQTYSVIIYFSALSTNDFQDKDSIALALGFNELKQLDEILLLISMPIYLFYGYMELRKYKKWLETTTSDSSFPDFNWLKNIFRLSIVIGIFLATNHTLDFLFDLRDQTILHYHLLSLFIAFVIYYLGFRGYLQPNYVFERVENFNQEPSSQPLTSDKTIAMVAQIKKVMDKDKLFLNPKLSIHDLAHTLDTSQKNLSVILNQHFQLGFRDFINTYRVEEIKSKLNNESFGHMSLLGIALDSGFNSEASFYRIFKKHTGVSPREYIQENNAN